MKEHFRRVFRPISHYIVVAFVVLSLNRCTLSFAQTNPGGAIGSSLFKATSAVLLKAMKEPKATVGVGPRRLDFNHVSLSKSALNLVEITNGTTSQIEIESLLTPSSGFRLASSITLPLTISSQTQALLTVEFFPTRLGNYNGELRVLYRTSSGGPLHKMAIELRGKGVRE